MNDYNPDGPILEGDGLLDGRGFDGPLDGGGFDCPLDGGGFYWTIQELSTK